MTPIFHKHLRNGHTTEAFQTWSKYAEDILFKVATIQGHQVSSSNIRRGQIKFHDIRKFPKVIDGQATTLQDRQTWKAICRAVECQKAPPGHRRDKTWQKLFSNIAHFPEAYQIELQSIAAQPVSLELAQRT